MIKKYKEFVSEGKSYRFNFGYCFITPKGLVFATDDNLELAKQVKESGFKVPNVPIEKWYVDEHEYNRECKMNNI